MCGICGFSGQPNQKLLGKMTKTLSHRGPDDEGFYFDQDINLGMRRLSIIDLAGGQQPISSENEMIWVVFNGEIYNYLELQRELKKKGHTFKTKSDTETIVHLYEEEGLSFPKKLNGMFAIALWDKRGNKLILVRDRVGIKPFYYFLKNGQLIFGSEIKAILAHPLYHKEIEFEALHHFFSLKHVPAPKTIFKDIFSLLPGELLVFTKNSIRKKEKYWQLKFKENKEISEQEASEKILELLTDSVRIEMRSDVPVGAYLSGGVDSSAVVALMTKFTNRPIITFCLSYQDKFQHKQADLEAARKLSKLFKTNHFEYIMSFQEVPENIKKIIESFDEPYGGVISTFFISLLIKKHVKVALSGDGGDELFGSYLSHRLARPMVDYLKSKKHENLGLNEKDTKTLLKIVDKQTWHWRAQLSVFSETEKSDFYSDFLKRKTQTFNTTCLWQDYFKNTTTRDPLNQMLEAEFKTIFPDQVLAFVDRLSMAHSIELRPPYLDHRLVEFSATMPGNLKIKNGIVKYIQKKAVKSLLPEEIINRPKEGFILPINQWLLEKLEKYVKDVLSFKRLKKHGFFAEGVVKNLITRYYKQKNIDTHSQFFIDGSNKIWCLIMFQLWWEKYFE